MISLKHVGVYLNVFLWGSKKSFLQMTRISQNYRPGTFGLCGILIWSNVKTKAKYFVTLIIFF